MRKLALLLTLACGLAFSQTMPPGLYSAAWQGKEIPCGCYVVNGQCTDLAPLDASGTVFTPPAPPGAGLFPGTVLTPNVPATIREVCVGHVINGSQANAYAVSGHAAAGAFVDHSTPYVFGTNYGCKKYPADEAPHKWNPGEYFDVHAGCYAGGTHWVTLQIWYSVP